MAGFWLLLALLMAKSVSFSCGLRDTQITQIWISNGYRRDLKRSVRGGPDPIHQRFGNIKLKISSLYLGKGAISSPGGPGPVHEGSGDVKRQISNTHIGDVKISVPNCSRALYFFYYYAGPAYRL